MVPRLGKGSSRTHVPSLKMSLWASCKVIFPSKTMVSSKYGSRRLRGYPCGASPKVLPPEQAAELLPWYMQWSRDLAAKMHLRRLVRDKARRTDSLPISNRPCDCAPEWRCEPHDACFIYDSCFCPGSGSFPPVKPPRS